MEKQSKVVFLSPPFYSHFQPMLALAKAFRHAGAEVVIACTDAFGQKVHDAGFSFWEIAINKNANTGVASNTRQEKAESKRLQAFIDATRSGAFDTLMFQAQHRQTDMLANPEQLHQNLSRLAGQLQPDLFVVDQLSYGVTLALHVLNLPFITFCPGHPTYIPAGGQYFGVPYAWPAGFEPGSEKIAILTARADQTDQLFTRRFNDVLQKADPFYTPVASAFRLTSSLAVLFNYPDFGHLHQEDGQVKKYFMGACFDPQPIDLGWKSRLVRHQGKYKILVSLGTFLSARSDVLERIILSLSKSFPEAVLYIAVGAAHKDLNHYEAENVVLSDFLPQTGLLPYVDVVIHHGGNNSFTEALYFGKPSVILPFSSDQFAIAHDAEKYRLGVVLDPNKFTNKELVSAVHQASGPEYMENIRAWSMSLHDGGPQRAASNVLRELPDQVVVPG